jgi:WD repeat-containing protein 61
VYLGLVSTSIDSNIRVWDLENGTLINNIAAAPLEAWKAKISPDKQNIATGSHNGDINIYNVSSGEKETSLPTKSNFLLSIAYVSFSLLFKVCSRV